MRSALYILTNRAIDTSSAGWIHIVPKGELPNKEAGVVQVLDDPSLDAIMADLRAQAAGNHWPGLYAGREHFIYDENQDSEALAWFKDFEKRADGIWAKDDGLTDIGREAIKNSRYKFTSFVVDPSKPQTTQKLGGNRVRVLKIDTVGFTNAANGKELLSPISNRDAATTPPKASAPLVFQPRQTLPPIKVSFPRIGHVGSDVLNAVVAIVRNRTGQTFDLVFNRALQSNADLMKPAYDNSDTSKTFGRLLNRIEKWSGLSAVATTERSANDVAALTNRFARPFLTVPPAMQWDILWRAAEELDRAGVPDRLLNRGPDGVTASEWKSANGLANDVFSFLDSEATNVVDRGPMLERAQPCQVRGVFRRCITMLMGQSVNPKYPGNLNRRQAFDWIKENEPIFWTLAMLSFDEQMEDAN